MKKLVYVFINNVLTFYNLRFYKITAVLQSTLKTLSLRYIKSIANRVLILHFYYISTYLNEFTVTKSESN